MTRMNHEGRNRRDKVGPTNISITGDERLEFLVHEMALLTSQLRIWEAKIKEIDELNNQNEIQIVKLAYELSVECIHGFMVLWCSSCKNTDFRRTPQFKSLMENKAGLAKEKSFAEANIDEINSEIQKLRR